MNKIYISHILDMSDVEATNWLIENQDEYVLVKKTDIDRIGYFASKQIAFSIGGDINEDSRINRSSKNFATAIVLNHISDLEEEYN